VFHEPSRVGHPLWQLRLVLPVGRQQLGELSRLAYVEPVAAGVGPIRERALQVYGPGDDLKVIVGELDDPRGVLRRVGVVER
jgi:hypothetical protein